MVLIKVYIDESILLQTVVKLLLLLIKVYNDEDFCFSSFMYLV